MAKINKAVRTFVPFEYVLMETYRDLGLKESEVCLLLMLDHLTELGNKVLGSDALSLKMSLPSEEIDQLLASLFSRKFISYENNSLSAEPAKERAYDRFQKAIETSEGVSVGEARLEGLYSFYEDKMNRTLTPLERNSISRFVQQGFDDDEIKNALLDCLRENHPSLKAVERTLVARRRSDDIKKEGASAVSDRRAPRLDQEGPRRQMSTLKERSATVLAFLRASYPDAHCALHFRSDYECLFAIALSAQTTDASVNRATPALFAAYPDVEAMAKATPEEVRPYIASLGLSGTKAKNLVAASKAIVELKI